MGYFFNRSNIFNTFIASVLVSVFFSPELVFFPLDFLYSYDMNIIRFTLLSEAGDSLSFSA